MKLNNRVRSLYFIFSAILLFILVSCGFKSMYEGSSDIPNAKWDKNLPVVFTVPVTDTLNNYNIVLGIRNNNDYPYENLFLFVDIKSPKGIITRDTLEIELCDKQGRWYGKGTGGIWQNKVYFKKNYQFLHSGNYEIQILHAMRNDFLEGIIDFGIKIAPPSK